MSPDSWPPQLKEWVAKCLGQMTDLNRTEAQAELKKVISDAYTSKTLWTTDWNGVQLQSLLPKPPPQMNNLKRKPMESPTSSKKAKKNKPLPSQSVPTDFNEKHAIEKRGLRFKRELDLEKEKQRSTESLATPSKYPKSALKANNHNSHLFNSSRSASPQFGLDNDGDPMDWEKHRIVGTCTEILKDYLRLTTEPKPETIRPLHILRMTLPALKDKWKKEGRESYNWVCNQFKSLRQDLTVQGINNDFTVHVYETHARIALEMADMVEYNACASQLKELYARGIPGKQEEFIAYRILDYLHGRNHRELNTLVGRLTPQQKGHTAISHALKVQHALSAANYHALFCLFEDAPWMSGYIMDHFVARERARAIVVMSKAYRTLPISFLTKELAFDNDQATLQFLEVHGGAPFVLNPNEQMYNRTFDCKAAQSALAQAYEEKYRRVQIHGAV